jgi:hypothetical protein
MSVSSASETIGTQLTESTASSFFTTNPKEFLQCMSFNVRMMLAFSFMILLICLFTSCFNSVFTPYDDSDQIRYDPVSLRGKGNVNYMMCKCLNGQCKCKSNMQNVQNIENFSNDEMYSFKTSQSSNYQSIPLLAPEDDNLMFGQAKRFVSSVDGTIIYRLEIYCNLLILDGNIYDKAPRNSIKHKYSVILQNTKTKGKMHVGDLVKDGDGIYKLKFISKENVQELATYDKVNIVYTLNGNEQTLLSGTFH